MAASPSTILFLCTGNYYRSRYSELLFNIHAEKLGLPWRADSCGLALERGLGNEGPIATVVVDRLTASGQPFSPPTRFPRQVTHEELGSAERVIALKEAEHRPLLTDRYPGWESRVEYWHVHDVDCATVEETLSEIERHIKNLVNSLAAENQIA